MRGLLLLAAVAAALTGTIAAEWRSSTLPPVAPPIAAAARPAPARPAADGGDVATSRTAQYVATILARPLVSPSRRPAAAAANEGIGLPRLTGIAISSAGKVAIFAGPSGAKSLAVGEGERVGAYLISSIGADGVTILGPQGGHILHPTFDPNPLTRPTVVGPIARPPPSPPAK